MSREIKFRGKRIDNYEWVYGYYVDYKCKHIIHGGNRGGQLYDDNYEVIPKTVGQYSNKTTYLGEDLYEGDIVKTEWDIVVIKFVSSAFYPMRKGKNGLFNKITNWDGVLKGEVIGNIYDNPELLEVQ